MKRILNIIISVIIVLSALTLSIIPNVVDIGNSREIVYTTNTGSKYHRSNCGSLWKSSHRQHLVSVARGSWSACKRCYPPKPDFPWYWKIGFLSWIIIGYGFYGVLVMLFLWIKHLFKIKPRVEGKAEPQQLLDKEQSISPGQQLWYTNKKTGRVESVSVLSVSETTFIIEYRGAPYELEMQALGTRLYCSIEEMQKKSFPLQSCIKVE